MFVVTLIVTVFIIAVYILRSNTKPKKFPPGPKWYPFFGSSAIVQKLTYEYGSQWRAFSHLAKQYSTQVLGLKLGTEHVIVVFGESNIRQVFMEKVFEGRPNTYFLKLRCLGKRMGITFTDGPLWQEQRKFTVKHLKNVGFGKTIMEKEIQEQMIVITGYINRNRKKPINPRSVFAKAVMNILWKFTAGHNIEEDRLNYLLDLFDKRSKAFTMAGGWLNQWPWLRYIFPELSGYNLIKEMNRQISEIIQEAIEKHKNGTVKENDFIYMFLSKVNNNDETFTEEQLKVICLDILIAGSQTTSNTLDFCILAVLLNQDIQNKIYEEINTILGNDLPSWEDTNRLIYTMAFLYEIQRYYIMVPLVGPRRALSAYELDGCVIPKESTVLIATGDVHFDSNLWIEPEKFRPERFINEKGLLYNTEHIYAFGLGRRRCPGDSLAKSFIFIVFVGILQKYMIKCCDHVPPSDEANIGLISSTRPYTAEFKLRCDN